MQKGILWTHEFVFLEAPAARLPVSAPRLLLPLQVRGAHHALHGRAGRCGEAGHQEGRVPRDAGIAVRLWIKIYRTEEGEKRKIHTLL